MNLHALRLFHTAAATGSVTRAAEDLHISQPAVTAQIKKLEAELGLQLLAPHGRGVALTEAGTLLAERAARLFCLEADTERMLAEYKEGRTGRLRIAATYLPANYMLPSPLAALQAASGELAVSLTTTNSRTAFELLLRYEADVAVVGGGRQAPPELACTPLFEDEMLFLAAAGHPLAGRTVELSDVLRHPFVIREEGSSSREKLLACCRTLDAGEPRVGLEVNGPAETIRAVSAGYGVTFVSALEAKDGLARGELAVIGVRGVSVVNPIALYTRRGEPLSPAARLFLSELRVERSPS